VDRIFNLYSEMKTYKEFITELFDKPVYNESIVESATLNSLNPTGGIFVDYNPKTRATASLGKNMTTLDKTMGGNPTDHIVVYRGTGSGKIVPGDYITTSKQLAHDYAGTGKVVALKVKKGDILDDKTEPLGDEYIYRPNAYKEIIHNA
jgi:hypothetical protein